MVAAFFLGGARAFFLGGAAGRSSSESDDSAMESSESESESDSSFSGKWQGVLGVGVRRCVGGGVTSSLK